MAKPRPWSVPFWLYSGPGERDDGRLPGRQATPFRGSNRPFAKTDDGAPIDPFNTLEIHAFDLITLGISGKSRARCQSKPVLGAKLHSRARCAVWRRFLPPRKTNGTENRLPFLNPVGARPTTEPHSVRLKFGYAAEVGSTPTRPYCEPAAVSCGVVG
jgi:hypothetical protein